MIRSDRSAGRSRVGLEQVVRPMTLVCLAAASGSDTQKVTAPDLTPTNAVGAPSFAGSWGGVRRVVSCTPGGEACAAYPRPGRSATSRPA
jgi:hypothetical protein